MQTLPKLDKWLTNGQKQKMIKMNNNLSSKVENSFELKKPENN